MRDKYFSRKSTERKTNGLRAAAGYYQNNNPLSPDDFVSGQRNVFYAKDSFDQGEEIDLFDFRCHIITLFDYGLASSEIIEL
ncbi:hypothetical protein RRG08_043338 [Elysia crispata]|uniref:Uncharacterized protein n=1 Tax=Elysia crispata TaxID=231223 RepID=A0AAE1EDK3_9GAST|nr:hypothetical protein RRG08_043338 [Elysia crispata]